MASAALRKLAKELQLKMDRDSCYGNLDGYCVTIREENNLRTANVSVSFSEEAQQADALGYFTSTELVKNWKMASAAYENNALSFRFAATIGTNKRLVEFLQALPAMLREFRVQGIGHCALCAQQNLDDTSYVQINNIVHHAHRDCVQEAELKVAEELAAHKEENKHSLRGAFGALLGGIVGSIPWVIVFYLGYFVGWLGFLIGLCAKKGYELLGGKPCKRKVAIVLIVTIVCVVLATFVGYCADLYIYAQSYGVSLPISDAIGWTFEAIVTDGETLSWFLLNAGVGLLFGIIGVASLMRDLRRESKGTSMDIRPVSL